MSEKAEILYWFRIRTTPVGGAPEKVRAQWVGTLLPVRRPVPVEGPESYVGRDVMDRRVVTPIADGVAVDPDDALKALRLFDRHAVGAWWNDLLARRPLTTGFVFRRCEGELIPPRMALMLHPELDDFDALDV